MEVKRGVSAVIFDKRGSVVHFLILHRSKGWNGWEFPKGGVEEGETPEQAVVREIKEETGLARFEVRGKLATKREFTKDEVLHSFEIYLVEGNMNVTVHVDRENGEHDNYLWANKERVLEKLYWEDEKSVFMDVLSIIQSKEF